MRILLVDDNEAALRALNLLVGTLGHEPTSSTRGEEALGLCRDQLFPMVITDIRMPGMDGMTLLGELKALPHMKKSDIVICTGHGTLDTAIEALRQGAYDFLSKPVNPHELRSLIERCAEHQTLIRENEELSTGFEQKLQSVTRELRRELTETRSQLANMVGQGQLVCESEAMQKLLVDIRMYHENPSVPVLIEGETGTGKEVISRLIHYGEGSKETPFVAINCSAISQELFESELFGYEGGAFTGSRQEGAVGKLESAGEGSLFLDEIGDMPLAMQPKLLRVLETRNYYAVGGTKKLAFGARVIAATNRNLSDQINTGAFREDLFHRLRVGHIRIPPLRERQADIPVLANHFLRRESALKCKHFSAFEESAMEMLVNLPWSGNVRELENTIQRAVLAGEGEVMTAAHLAFMEARESSPASVPTASASGSCQSWLQDFDTIQLPDQPLNLGELYKTLVNKAVEKFGGNKTKAAEYLNISRGSLRNRLRDE